MLVVSFPSDAPLALQAEEIAEARWFSRDEAISAFPVRQQRDVVESCLANLLA